MQLNEQSPIPLYMQLAKRLRADIECGKHGVDEKIPSEHILAEQHGIGRPTVRQATDLLVREGLLQRRRGSGTYVLPPPKRIDLFSLAGTSAALQQSQLPSQTTLLRKASLLQAHEQAPEVLAQVPVYALHRLTRIESKAVLLEHIYLRADLFQGIEHISLEDKSLSRIVRDEFHLQATAADQSFNIVTPTGDVAGQLELAKQQPVLHVSRMLHFGDNQNAIYCDIYCRTDRFQFSQSIIIPDITPGLTASGNAASTLQKDSL